MIIVTAFTATPRPMNDHRHSLNRRPAPRTETIIDGHSQRVTFYMLSGGILRTFFELLESRFSIFNYRFRYIKDVREPLKIPPGKGKMSLSELKHTYGIISSFP